MGKKDGKKHLILAENRNLSANSLYNFILRKALKKRKICNKYVTKVMFFGYMGTRR